jgi:predicted small secreted protein|tara:strand:- start:33467 stop:33601 length:135 start_codon:yes stop_codon:yes gene_type:complete
MKPLKIIIAICALSFSLSACGNTIHGLGQDIERAGEKVQSATKK